MASRSGMSASVGRQPNISRRREAEHGRLAAPGSVEPTGRQRLRHTSARQALVQVSRQSIGWVAQKSCGTPGTIGNPPAGSTVASCSSGQLGRMSSPAAINVIGTGLSASARQRPGWWMPAEVDRWLARGPAGTTMIL